MSSLKKTLSIEDVTAICDSREQLPLDLSPLKVISGTLSTGDYSVVGLTDVIAIERKSLADLVMCCGRERERFEKEIKRLLSYETRAIVVECHEIEVIQQKYRSSIHPNSVIGSVDSWISRGIPVIWAGDRATAGMKIARIMFHTARRRYREGLQFMESFDTVKAV